LEVDRLALLDLFNFGYLGGTRTLFRGIELLSHASVVTVTPGGVARRRYWDYRYRNTGTRFAPDDLVAEGAGLLRQAVRRYLDRFSRPGVPLSGGLDSRTILGFAAEERSNLPVFHCAWYAGEERLAHELCHRAGGDWHRYDPLEFDLEEATREGMELSDGNVHCHQFWFLPVVRQVQRERLADLLFDGYLMDVFLGDTFLVLPRRERYSAEEQRGIINSVWRRGSPAFVRRAFLPEFAREYEEANRASIEEGLNGIDEPHLSNLLQRFSLTNRSNRYSVALPNVHRQYVEYGYPGLDYDLTDFYLRLPPEVKAGARFYRRVIGHALPASAAVPWVKTGKPLDADKGWLTSRLGRLPVHQLGAMVLLRATGGRLDLSHRGDLNRHFRRDPAYRGFITGVLRDPRTWSRGIIDRGGVERLIGFIDHGWPVLSLVQSLVTVELWHRRFVDG
ncbi:MAG: asparagine synthase-related protein, partial [Candidatus Latescibacterota bacterium]